MRIIDLSKPIVVKIADLTLKLKPISFPMKEKLFASYRENYDTLGAEKALDRLNYTVLQLTIQDVSGLIDQTGAEWKPVITEEGMEADSLDSLLLLEVKDELLIAVTTFLNGFPKDGKITYPTGHLKQGQEVEGVSIIQEVSEDTKKK